jgi:hypothetical protein
LADKFTPLILEALSRVAADTEGVPLHGGKNVPGLFSTSPAGKQAAQRSKEEGLLRVVRTETKARTVTEFCAITEKGLAYLLDQVNPKRVVEEFVRALENRQTQISDLLDAARDMENSLASLKLIAERVLQRVERPTAVGPVPCSNGNEAWPGEVVAHLARWHESGAPEDCTLPTLYSHATQIAPHLTIGQFHDGLRKLHQEQQIYLHPWSGPLHELPEPALALLTGHEIAYYASIRSSD